MDVRYPVEADLDRLLAVGPQVASTAVGPVEYAQAGEGPVLVSVHGSYGGWDYGLGMAAVFALNGFRVIAPSRPGFLGTPLASGQTYEEWHCGPAPGAHRVRCHDDPRRGAALDSGRGAPRAVAQRRLR